MSYSFYEIYTTSQRAFRGMGFPFGADEDAAYIVAWLELNNLNGVSMLKNTIEQIDWQYDGILNHKEIDKKITALSLYKSQLRKGHRDKNSIIKLSQIRGLEIGVDFAEAYHLHRLFF